MGSLFQRAAGWCEAVKSRIKWDIALEQIPQPFFEKRSRRIRLPTVIGADFRPYLRRKCRMVVIIESEKAFVHMDESF